MNSTENDFNKNTPTPYDDAFRTMMNDCVKLLIPVINEVFGKNYSGNERIIFRPNEHFINQQDGKEQKRITDSSFSIISEENSEEKFILECSENANFSTFEYYYNRMKKMTLLRGYEQKAGMDLSWFYDVNNIFDAKKKQEQEDRFDNMSLEEIADTIDNKISSIRETYVDNVTDGGGQAGEGIDELLAELKETPEIGYPLYGPYINTVLRGARLKKFYLRSAATGVGKTRSMIADACYIGCGEMFKDGKWIQTGQPQPVLYIATEQDQSEIQTMMIAFLSGVNEEHILYGEYEQGEWERVGRAAAILKRAPIYFESLPDFSLKDIENKIKRGVREHGVQYVFHDYLHTSMKILEEITKRSGGVRLREDNILFMISIRLKDLCNQYGIFIMSSTQLNGEYQNATVYDQNLLRGAKAIADKIDAGSIMLQLNDSDREVINKISAERGLEMPNLKISIYKNRRGRYNHILLWCKADLGICRINPLFATSYNYEIIEMEDYKINVSPRKEESAF